MIQTSLQSISMNSQIESQSNKMKNYTLIDHCGDFALEILRNPMILKSFNNFSFLFSLYHFEVVSDITIKVRESIFTFDFFFFNTNKIMLAFNNLKKSQYQKCKRDIFDIWMYALRLSSWKPSLRLKKNTYKQNRKNLSDNRKKTNSIESQLIIQNRLTHKIAPCPVAK